MARKEKATHWLVFDKFLPSPSVRAMDREFRGRFDKPLEANPERFVWDYWHVPGQYTLLRTPAETFFTAKAYDAFMQKLGDWGRRNLGCQSVSPPWLSVYVDGCGQELHADNPHGPWAFVFSLTHWEQRKFLGGETRILRPEILDYWRSFDSSHGLEEDQITQRIAPKHNRLVVFNPRLPHEVTRVRGVSDPREARIVIHGWFTQPRTSIEGSLSEKSATEALNNGLGKIFEALEGRVGVTGYTAFEITTRPSGEVSKSRILIHSLVSREGEDDEINEVLAFLTASLQLIKFPKAKGPSRLTVPILFS